MARLQRKKAARKGGFSVQIKLRLEVDECADSNVVEIVS
jgi:hypothetical protein